MCLKGRFKFFLKVRSGYRFFTMVGSESDPGYNHKYWERNNKVFISFYRIPIRFFLRVGYGFLGKIFWSGLVFFDSRILAISTLIFSLLQSIYEASYQHGDYPHDDTNDDDDGWRGQGRDTAGTKSFFFLVNNNKLSKEIK